MNDAPVETWIVEDRDTLREAYAALIEGAGDLRLAGAYRTGEEALEALDDADPPDLVLMDIELPGIDGIETLKRVRAQAPDVRVLMLTIHEDRDSVFEALCAGAAGYVLKPASADSILRAIRDLLAGQVPMSPSIARRVLHIFRGLKHPKSRYGLSAREREILEHLVLARNRAEIARALSISEHTVGNHVRNIYRKLEVHTRAGAVAKAVSERLVAPRDSRGLL